MLNVFAFCAIFFLIVTLALTGGLIYVQVTKNKPKVGTLVRTTFTGNPAVVTSALWGVSPYPTSATSFSTAAQYGEGYDHDSINALHCDIYQGSGTYSTWVSDGGINFKNSQRYGFLTSASTMYFDGKTCQQDSDCSVTEIPCGPTEAGWKKGTDVNGVSNPASEQCPPGVNNTVFCNACAGPPTGEASYCSSISKGQRGYCVNTSDNNPLNCQQMSTRSTNKYCLSFKPVAEGNKVPFDRVNSCSGLDNYGSICSNSVEGDWFCETSDPLGNLSCGLGQQCIPNTTSLSGWCPPNQACSTFLQTAQNVCAGDIYPNISINTLWIAEGKLISTDGTTSTVQWERVQNTYLGIGPSPKVFSSVSETRKQAVADKSWVYSDCRFIDDGSNGRHASVSRGLLGTSVTNPSWAPIFDYTRNSATENLLYIGTSTGNIEQSPEKQKTPYYRSAWSLRSTDIPNSQLERIWFYSVFPMEGIPAHLPSKLQAAVQVNFRAADLDATIALHGQ